MIAGSAVETTICHQSSPPEVNGAVPAFGVPAAPPAPVGTKRITFAPAAAFAFRMNWRSEPWIVRAAEVSSSVASPPRVLVTTLNEKPELMLVMLPPPSGIVTRLRCSAVVSAAALSETVPSLPPKNAPAEPFSPLPVQASATP